MTPKSDASLIVARTALHLAALGFRADSPVSEVDLERAALAFAREIALDTLRRAKVA